MQLKLRSRRKKKIFFLPISNYPTNYLTPLTFQSLQLFIQMRMIEQIGSLSKPDGRDRGENFESFRNSWRRINTSVHPAWSRYCRWQGKEKWYYDTPPPIRWRVAIFPLFNHRPLSLHHHPPRIINSFQRGFA